MKYAIAWPLAQLFFWFGHAVSRPMNRWEWAGRLYWLYNQSMLLSVRLSYWGGLNLWSKPA